MEFEFLVGITDFSIRLVSSLSYSDKNIAQVYADQFSFKVSCLNFSAFY